MFFIVIMEFFNMKIRPCDERDPKLLSSSSSSSSSSLLFTDWDCCVVSCRSSQGCCSWRGQVCAGCSCVLTTRGSGEREGRLLATGQLPSSSIMFT